MNGNDFMSWVLRSPFHGLLSRDTMLIAIRGRKTGKIYTTPVNYCREGDYVWVMTSRSRSWWRNLQGGASVNLLLSGKFVAGFAQTEIDPTKVETCLLKYVRYIPQAAKPLGIRVGNKIPNTDDIARVAKDRLFVKIKITD